MRSLRIMLPGVLLVVLAACGGGPASPSAAESTGGASSAASPSAPAAETPAASSDDGGPGATDVEALLAELEPPNSRELSRTEVPGQGLVVAYESTDQVGDLKAYYVQKIAELNLSVITTNEAANTWAVAFGSNAAGTGLGGTIAIQNAGDVSNVVVTLAQGS